MKQLVFVLGCVMCLSYTTNAFAQNYNQETEERETENSSTIILDDKNNEGKTTIEIKNGQLIVDGKKVANIDENTEVKIVKKNTITDNFGNRSFDMPFNTPMEKSFRTLQPRRAMLGVLTEDANPGAKINKIIPGSAAEKAGLEIGDIITAVDGKNIQNFEDLVAAIAEYDEGDKVEIEIYRSEELKKLNATLQGNEDESALGNMNGSQFELPFKDFKELFDMPNNSQMFFKSFSTKAPKIGLEIEESQDGLEVTNVKPNSAAADAGFEKGDKIKTVDGNPVTSLNALKKEITVNQDNKELYFGVKRKGALKSLSVAVPQTKKRAEF